MLAHLRVALDIFDADRAAAFDQDAGGLVLSAHREVGPVHGRAQIADGGAAAPGAALGDLVEAAARLPLAIEVRIVG